jgi:hypothetical protein
MWPKLRPVPTRLVGLLLFLPVPLVLFLFTRAPLGILASLAAGVLLMVTHRLYARPWALARARARCLWCGAGIAPTAASAPALAIEDPLGRVEWRACGEAHARSARAVLAWAHRHSGFLKTAILGTLVVFLACGLSVGLGWQHRAAFDDAVACFRLAIAATVLTLAWRAPGADPGDLADVVRSPFPVHLSALVGQWSVLWLFRLVGVLWIAQGALHVSQRLASLP